MPSPTRRTFVSTLAGIGAASVISDWVSVRSALAHAATAVAQQPAPPFTSFTPDEAAILSAAVERIMPSDGTPGAKEAGVVYFIDRAFGTFMNEQLSDARKDLRDLNKRATKRNRNVQSFAQLSGADQDTILREIQRTPLFNGLRYLTIVGMFANPSWGGNRDSVGWKLIGFEPHGLHKPPFGYYDAQVLRRGNKT